MHRCWLVVVVVAAMSCGSPDPQLVANIDIDRTCADLAAAATPIERRVIETDLVEATKENGSVLVEVLGALMDTCPNEAAALLGSDVPTRPAIEVSLELDECRAGETGGTLTNQSNDRADITIEVQFFDADQVLLGTANAYVRGLAGGATGRWDAHYFGDDSPVRCAASVVRAWPR